MVKTIAKKSAKKSVPKKHTRLSKCDRCYESGCIYECVGWYPYPMCEAHRISNKHCSGCSEGILTEGDNNWCKDCLESFDE